MITRDLTVTITNDSEGTSLVLKTVSAFSCNKISITGDLGVFEIQDIRDALNELQNFALEKEEKRLDEVLKNV